MFKLTNPYALAGVLIGLLVIGIIVGTKWDTWFPKKNKTPGGAGTGGGIGAGGTGGRIAYVPTAAVVVPLPIVPVRTTGQAPATILFPVSTVCSGYTTQNPYSYMGCSYVFGGYISYAGRRWCLLKKVGAC